MITDQSILAVLKMKIEENRMEEEKRRNDPSVLRKENGLVLICHSPLSVQALYPRHDTTQGWMGTKNQNRVSPHQLHVAFASIYTGASHRHSLVIRSLLPASAPSTLQKEGSIPAAPEHHHPAFNSISVANDAVAMEDNLDSEVDHGSGRSE